MQRYGNIEGIPMKIVHVFGLVSYTDPCSWWLIKISKITSVCAVLA